MHLRLGPFNLITDDALHRLCVTGPRKDVEQMEATIRRQHDLLVEVEAERNVALAQAKEAIGLFAEQQDQIDRLQAQIDTILRHPVSGPKPDDAA